MAGLSEGSNEPPGSLKATATDKKSARSCYTRPNLQGVGVGESADWVAARTNHPTRGLLSLQAYTPPDRQGPCKSDPADWVISVNHESLLEESQLTETNLSP
ncbi:hypothetical protein ANN_09678 [Periplaneta americana]|uniref:Uncharacterized protein n=1 Tax=Periplaneta americana TaxID=6978 RepID=A0ABQ8TLY7_PERAM|nr:hypothetical protein ANN_09678 [Periplaneta americana]